MQPVRSTSFTAGMRGLGACPRPQVVMPAAPAPPKQRTSGWKSRATAVVAKFSLSGLAGAALNFLVHPSRAVAEVGQQARLDGCNTS